MEPALVFPDPAKPTLPPEPVARSSTTMVPSELFTPAARLDENTRPNKSKEIILTIRLLRSRQYCVGIIDISLHATESLTTRL
jgi:hypothetical protein